MSALIAEVRACQGCGACLLTCPEHAIRPCAASPAGSAVASLVVQPEQCTGCGECVEVCPVDAIVLIAANLEPESEPTP
ncbi:NAD-dependent dihydropyrimidine dehydrogenase PreA subunit [Catenulispora sp. GAS73]|uniref:4Fe-4S binding protein n=1 Tax=Catenulispora sp. GAS73 TaxID=3156269 RepID=UPI00351861D1